MEVTAAGSALVDKAIGDAGDVDTAVAVLRSAGGRLCVISNSRRAAYGYDQRIEVHGSEGMVSAGNPVATTVTRADRSGFATDPLNDFFMDRYADAYREEIATFCAVVRGADVPYPSGLDGLAALALADAASESLATGRAVRVTVWTALREPQCRLLDEVEMGIREDGPLIRSVAEPPPLG